MLNRPATRIEVKLEDDLIDYEESTAVRKNVMIKLDEECNFTPELVTMKDCYSSDNKSNNIESSLFNNFNLTKPNVISKFTPKQEDSNSKGDISMR